MSLKTALMRLFAVLLVLLIASGPAISQLPGDTGNGRTRNVLDWRIDGKTVGASHAHTVTPWFTVRDTELHIFMQDARARFQAANDVQVILRQESLPLTVQDLMGQKVLSTNPRTFSLAPFAETLRAAPNEGRFLFLLRSNPSGSSATINHYALIQFDDRGGIVIEWYVDLHDVHVALKQETNFNAFQRAETRWEVRPAGDGHLIAVDEAVAYRLIPVHVNR